MGEPPATNSTRQGEEFALAYSKAVDAQLGCIRGQNVAADDPAYSLCVAHKQSLASQIKLLNR